MRIVKTNEQPEPTLLVIFGRAGDLTWQGNGPKHFGLLLCPSTLRGKTVRGYGEEIDVSHHAKTKTLAVLQLSVDNWRPIT